VLHDYFGGGYGRPTAEGKAAIRILLDYEGIALDPTYTGKAFAAMLDFIRRKQPGDRPILYWHTLNSRPLPCDSTFNPAMLPPSLSKYFSTPLCDPEL
jgi:hypothetical protein